MARRIVRWGAVVLVLGVGAAVAMPRAPVPEDLRTRALVLRAEDRRDSRDPALLGALGHRDAAIRARAVRALGRIGDPASVPVVAARLGDASLDVRREAAFALGEIEHPSALSSLAATTSSSDPLARAFAAEALAKIAWPTTADRSFAGRVVVRQFLGGEGGRWELETPILARVVAASWRFGRETPGLSAAIAELARDERPEVADAALVAAARIADPDLAPTLREGAASGRQVARLAAARGLTRLAKAAREAKAEPDPAAPAALLPLASDPDEHVRSEGLRALAAHAPPADAGRLLREGFASESHHVQRATLEAAAAWDVPESARIAREALALERSDLGGARLDLAGDAALALAARAGLAALPDLERLAGEDDWRRRSAAAESLAAPVFGADAAGRALQDRLLADPDPRVTAAALDSVVASERRDGDVIALAHLAAADAVVRAVAASGLPRLVTRGMPRAEAAEALRRTLREAGADVSSDARLAAVEALAELGPDGAGDLAAARRHVDPQVRQRAASLAKAPIAAPVAMVQPLDFYLAAAADEELAAPRVLRLHTERGVVDVDLMPRDAILTVRAIEGLVAQRFHDGLTFHRVVPAFVAQGGDPRGDGWGGPGFTLRCEIHPAPYVRGTAGMALSGKDTGGSQFFFTLTPQPHLEGGYTVFGQVRDESLLVVDRLRRHDVVRWAEIWPVMVSTP